MWMSGRGGGGLEEVSEGGVKLIPTKKFLKAIKAHDKGRINNALARIGTGSKDEEKLKGRDDYSIRAGGGERVIFEYRGKEEAVLKDYHPDHDYDKSSR
jgi:plasmid maintenance system killer protein